MKLNDVQLQELAKYAAESIMTLHILPETYWVVAEGRVLRSIHARKEDAFRACFAMMALHSIELESIMKSPISAADSQRLKGFTVKEYDEQMLEAPF